MAGLILARTAGWSQRRRGHGMLNLRVGAATVNPGMEGGLEVNPARVGTLYADRVEVPYVEFGQVEPALKLVHGGEDYWYVRTLPLKGYGAVMARPVRELPGD